MPVSKNRRKNGKKPPLAVKKKRTADPPPLPAQLPDRRAMEGMMAQVTGGLFGGRVENSDDALGHAQELVYDAWEAASKRDRIALARQALEISELCADAHVLLAEEAAKNRIDARGRYETGVIAGEKALGPQAFEEDVGHFWGILETRPYMRARAGLAETLWNLGERDAAIAHLQDMLRLNPNDNQGLRHVLTGWLLATKDHAALKTLIEAYDDDVFAEWAYTKTLLAFRQTGPSGQAKTALETAGTRNAHVPALLTGAKKIPRRIADHYSLGSREEAVLYVLANRENWSATEGALQWLHEAAQNLPPPPKKHRRSKNTL